MNKCLRAICIDAVVNETFTMFFMLVKAVLLVIWSPLHQALYIIVNPCYGFLSLHDNLCCSHPWLISGGECDFVKVWMCYWY